MAPAVILFTLRFHETMRCSCLAGPRPTRIRSPTSTCFIFYLQPSHPGRQLIFPMDTSATFTQHRLYILVVRSNHAAMSRRCTLRVYYRCTNHYHVCFQGACWLFFCLGFCWRPRSCRHPGCGYPLYQYPFCSTSTSTSITPPVEGHTLPCATERTHSLPPATKAERCCLWPGR